MADDKHTIRQPGSGRRAIRTVRATVVSGPDAGKSASSRIGCPFSVGTASDNSLVLTDRTVSRYHLELEPIEGGVSVVDLGSLNGTSAGAVRIERARVPPPTDLQLGDTFLRIDDGDTLVDDAVTAVEPIPGMVTVSDAMRRVGAEVARLAASAVSVLVQGETGTGKEVVARALHAMSPRKARPFVVVDCGSMPATLIASELFGHERGAFTGADRSHAGAFERAHGGTIFLDEIGELPLAVQPTLLGALERRMFRKVGGTKEVEVDVRVVAATHRDLRAEVNVDRFRADLYYRLAVARIVVPPLRDRPEDVEALTQHFVTEITGEGVLPFGPETMRALRAHRWSGNVRELRNVVEAAVAMGEVKLDTTKPGVGDAGAPAGRGEPLTAYKEARARALHDFERLYLGQLIQQCGGNASEAARVARMDRQYLLGLLRRHDLR